jgi:hypothetical protein
MNNYDFSKRLHHYRRSTHQVNVFNENIVRTNQINQLGITLDYKLTYRSDKFCILRTANYRERQLYPILNKSSTIHIYFASIIYKSLLRSILWYASPESSYAANTYKNTLQTFQNKVLRIITKLARVTPIATLHTQKEISLLRRHFKR